jgi:hypothetical protein
MLRLSLLVKTYLNGRAKMIEDYRKLLDLVLSEGLDTIESLSDEELRKAIDEANK